MSYVWIGIGGALGSVARFWLNGIVSEKLTGGAIFPLGTLVVNVAGSLVIGVLAALTMPEGKMSSEGRTFVTQFFMVGVCGGFTTFSSFSLQTLTLIREREWLYAGGNVMLSVALCLLATWLGFILGLAFTSTKGH